MYWYVLYQRQYRLAGFYCAATLFYCAATLFYWAATLFYWAATVPGCNKMGIRKEATGLAWVLFYILLQSGSFSVASLQFTWIFSLQ